MRSRQLRRTVLTLLGITVGTALAPASTLRAQQRSAPQPPPSQDGSPPPGRTSAVLRVPGKTIEVIGLRRWTLAMVQDSMAKYAPGESLASHACAAVLRYKLGFADAGATTLTGGPPGDSLERVVVTVVEPQDSARVGYRRVPMDTTAPYAPWANGVALVRQHPMAVQGAVFMYLPWRRDSSATPMEPSVARDSASVRQYLRFVAAHATTADEATAMHLLRESPDYPTRVAAASVLLNFVERDDRAAFALVHALTESDGMVKGMASAALTTFAITHPHPVAWGRVPETVSDVHALLDGTSVFELTSVMQLLLRTGVSPADARPLLGHGGGRMLLAYLGAVAPPLRDQAHQLLVALKGDDLGLDPAPWVAWLTTL